MAFVLAWCTGGATAADVAPLKPAVDANPAGQAAVAWSRPDGVHVVTVDGVTGATAAATLTGTRSARTPQVAIDDAGDVLVVWETVRTTGVSPCRGCAAGNASDGVFAVLGHLGAGFGVPVRLANPLAGYTGGEDQLADPLLRMDARGDAVVAGSDGFSTWVATRTPGGALGPAELAARDFVATGLALGHDAEVLVADVRSRVITRPPGGAFGAPVLLPGGDTPYGPGAVVAADDAGDAIALYRGASPVLASRRAPDGTWGTPDVLTTVSGAAGRDVAIAGDGTALATFAQVDRDPREGGRGALMAATMRPDTTTTTTQVNAPETDGDAPAGDLDADAMGRFALAYTQAPPMFAPSRPFVTLLQPNGAIVGPAALTASGFGPADTVRAALSGDGVLAVWTERSVGDVRLQSRWLPGGSTITLDHVPDPSSSPAAVTPPTLQLATQPVRQLDSRGRVLVSLRCRSPGGSSCTGTLRLTAGPQHWTAGRAVYALAPNTIHGTRISLTARARRALHRQGRLTLTAAGAPGRVQVRAPRRPGWRAADDHSATAPPTVRP